MSKIIESSAIGKWVYSGKLYEKGGNLLVDTEIASGDEEHFHYTAIDTVLETTRRYLGKKGGAICAAAKGLFGVITQYGCNDLSRNHHFAVSASNIACEESQKELVSFTSVSNSKEPPVKVVISCPSCQGKLRVPDTFGELMITCKHCKQKFLWSPGK